MRHHGGQRPERDVGEGVAGAPQDVGGAAEDDLAGNRDVRVDEAGDRRDDHEDRGDLHPLAELALLAGLAGVHEPGDQRVEDGVPQAGDQEDRAGDHRGDADHIRVVDQDEAADDAVAEALSESVAEIRHVFLEAHFVRIAGFDRCGCRCRCHIVPFLYLLVRL